MKAVRVLKLLIRRVHTGEEIANATAQGRNDNYLRYTTY